MYKILILDDDPNVQKMLMMALNMEYSVFLADTIESGLEVVRSENPDACLVDLRLGTESGIDALQKIMAYDRGIVVIIMTAFADISTSVKAIKLGAYNYLTKPLDIMELFSTVSQALEQRTLRKKVHSLEKNIKSQYGINGLMGKSQPMLKLYEQIDRLKDSEASVLINGESGTGKELVARALHYAGKLKAGPFVAINCAAIPENLLEDQMFGHKKGAFTGAVSDTKGKFEAAEGGTLFLDEVGEMPLALQAKILRVLEERTVTPIGSNVGKPIHVRVVAATNRDLKAMVEDGTFRRDLLFRLNVITLYTPALRSIPEDIPLLIQHYLDKFNQKYDKKIQGVSSAAAEALKRYNYPGNVRELINIIEYAVIFSDEDSIYIENLPESVKQANDSYGFSRHAETVSAGSGKTMAEIERQAIMDTLVICGGHIGRSAFMLGISDKGLRNKLVAYGIDAKTFSK